MPSREHFGSLALVTALALAVALGAIIAGVSADGGDEVPSAPPKSSLGYPSLSSHLNHLADGYGSGQLSQQQAAAVAPMNSGGSVAVTIHLDGHVSDVLGFLEDGGGDIRNVGNDYIEAYVPVGLLGQLSQQPGVTRVQEIIPPQPAYGNVTSQAVGLHHADSWHNSELRGQGMKVGVIDVGFAGYSSLMGVELPANVVARCYTDVGVFSFNLSDCEAEEEPPASTPAQCRDYVAGLYAGGEPHGTAVAEAVIDIAPDATLYISQPSSRGDLQETAAWMADQGVTVINYSVGWIFDGPGDGTSPLSVSPLNTVDQAVARGITWANSAGNRAGDAWLGSYSDQDGDGVISFNNSTAEINPIALRECRGYTFQLRWEDSWDAAATDLDIYLYDRSTGDILDIPAGWGYVGSRVEQSGASGHIPLELFFLRSPYTTTDVGVIIVHESGPVPDWIHLELFSGPGGLGYSTDGSITNPAESANPGLLAVGAAPFFNTHDVEVFSSRGPTPDGRIKPDIVGVDCAVSVSYEYFDFRGNDCWFPGTSQASPHVAGLATLVKQRFPDFTPAEVADYLINNAEERGSPGADNTWGHGFAVLPPLDTDLAPTGCAAGEITADGSPVTGSWGDDCQSVVRSGRQSRFYQFTLAESADISVVLESDDAETVLYLREGAGTTTGAHIPGGFNEGEVTHNYRRASIHENLAAGSYTVEATTYNVGGTGSFTLTVSGAAGSGAPGLGGCKVGEIAVDGSPVDGNWGAGCESQSRPGSQARYYQFTLSESADITVVLESQDAETVLYLRQGSGVTTGDTTLNGFNDGEAAYDYHRATISGTIAAGTYTVEATTYTAGETGSFTLTVSTTAGTAGPAVSGCDAAEIAADGIPVMGTWGADCVSSVRADRQARYYQFTLAETADITVVLKSQNAETVLYLREGVGITSGIHVGFNEGEADYDYRRASITENLAAGTYTIEATTYAVGETGSFILAVSGATGTDGPGLSSCEAGAVTVDGSPVIASWGADCLSIENTGRQARFYQFALAETTDITVVLESPEAETVLYLRQGAGVTTGATTPNGFNDGEAEYDYHRSSVTETLSAGSYTIEATTYAVGETGTFTLTVSRASGLVVPGSSSCAAGEITADGIPVTGSWGADCLSNANAGRQARYYQFTLEESADIAVVLESDEAETVLYLRQGAGVTAGATTSNGFNDGEAEYDYHRASITETLAAGTYTIEATTYAVGETGAFTLTVGLGAGTTGSGISGCETGDITPDGIPVAGRWGTDCLSDVRTGRQASYYQFSLEESTGVTVVLESDDAETVLYLRQGAGVTTGDTTLNGFNDGEAEYNYHRATIEETLAAGTYTIEATTYAVGETGSFNLALSVEAQ